MERTLKTYPWFWGKSTDNNSGSFISWPTDEPSNGSVISDILWLLYYLLAFHSKGNSQGPFIFLFYFSSLLHPFACDPQIHQIISQFLKCTHTGENACWKKFKGGGFSTPTRYRDRVTRWDIFKVEPKVLHIITLFVVRPKKIELKIKGINITETVNFFAFKNTERTLN